MLKATLKWIVFLAVGLVATLASADQDPVLKTQKDWQSYAMGVEAGTNLKRLGIDFDLDIVIRGMKDAYTGNKLLLSEKNIKTSLHLIASELMRKKDAARIEAGLDNKKKGEAFLAENKAQADVVTLPSGLQYKILKAGDGKKPTEADTVECRYRGTHIDGTVFETSGEKPGYLHGRKSHSRMEGGPQTHVRGRQVAALHSLPARLRTAGIGPDRPLRDDHL